MNDRIIELRCLPSVDHSIENCGGVSEFQSQAGSMDMG